MRVGRRAGQCERAGAAIPEWPRAQWISSAQRSGRSRAEVNGRRCVMTIRAQRRVEIAGDEQNAGAGRAQEMLHVLSHCGSGASRS